MKLKENRRLEFIFYITTGNHGNNLDLYKTTSKNEFFLPNLMKMVKTCSLFQNRMPTILNIFSSGYFHKRNDSSHVFKSLHTCKFFQFNVLCTCVFDFALPNFSY